MARRRRRKEVSEKSLELNVCAELLQCIRSWPRCSRALWFGLTQAQERQEGIDARIRNAGPGVSIMFQFKAPWATSLENTLYKFSVNEQQHEAMEDLAAKNWKDVYYVFPLFSTWSKVDQHAPDLADDTWVVPVSSDTARDADRVLKAFNGSPPGRGGTDQLTGHRYVPLS